MIERDKMSSLFFMNSINMNNEVSPLAKEKAKEMRDKHIGPDSHPLFPILEAAKAEGLKINFVEDKDNTNPPVFSGKDDCVYIKKKDDPAKYNGLQGCVAFFLGLFLLGKEYDHIAFDTYDLPTESPEAKEATEFAIHLLMPKAKLLSAARKHRISIGKDADIISRIFGITEKTYNYAIDSVYKIARV